MSRRLLLSTATQGVRADAPGPLRYQGVTTDMPSGPLSSGAALVGVTVIDPSTGDSRSVSGRLDTGADQTLVDHSIVQAVGLVKIGSDSIEGVFGNPQQEGEYLATLDFGGYGAVAEVKVLAAPILQQLGFPVLVGVDVLGSGTFDYEGLKQRFSLTLGAKSVPRPRSPLPIIVGIPLAVALGGVAWSVATGRR